MKKKLLTILAVAAIAFSGCKKDSGNKPGGSSADSYLPLTSGTSWTYKDTYAGNNGTDKITMTGGTTAINGKTYYNATSVSSKSGTSDGYFYAGNHAFSTRGSNAAAGLTIELQLGMDNQAAGYTWTTTPTDGGEINGYPAKTINTIKETNINKTVNGKQFSNVIHTQVDLQYNLGDGFESFAIYDIYLAKGVGMIEMDSQIYDTVVDVQTITDYTIK